MTPALKILIGTAALVTSALQWLTGPGSAEKTEWTGVDAERGRCPIVYEDPDFSGFTAQARLAFVLAPTDCALWRYQLPAWKAQAKTSGIADMVGVSTVSHEITGRRLAHREAFPFPVALDSSGWFAQRFEMTRTPFLVLPTATGEAWTVDLSGDPRVAQDRAGALLAALPTYSDRQPPFPTQLVGGSA